MKFCHKIVLALSAFLCSTTASAAVYTQVKATGSVSYDMCLTTCITNIYTVTATFNFDAGSTSYFDPGGIAYAFVSSSQFVGGRNANPNDGFRFDVPFSPAIDISLPGLNYTPSPIGGTFSALVRCDPRMDCPLTGKVSAFNLRTSNTSFGTEGVTFTSETRPVLPPAAPEPATWMTMVAGFGATGFALRRRRRSTRMLVTA